jgi:hypothetical protein
VCGNINIIGVLFIQPSMSTHMWARSVLACITTHNTNGNIAPYCSALPIAQSMLACAVKLFCLSDHVTYRPWVSSLWPAKLYHVTHGHICKLCTVYSVYPKI